MIAELGHYLLILAFGLAVIQATFPMVGAARSDGRMMMLGQPAAYGQFIFVLLAFLALTYSYVMSDFSLRVVASNSHSLKPMLYKISGVWGNHEGSLLLWVMFLALFGAMVAFFGRNLPRSLRARVLSIQALIGIGFYLFMLLTSNPFERLPQVPFEGNGLNPQPSEATVQQGARELSNVSAVEELVRMIVGMRHYEAAQRALRSIDEAVQQNTNPQQG